MFQEQSKSQQRERGQQERVRTQYRSRFPGNITCPYCGASVPSSMELCPECHHPLHTGTCTYCGSAMDADDQFCPECGGPRQGITCPQCGNLNFRSFCNKCNAPLDELATEEMEKAKNDPVFIKMVQLAKQMAAMEERLLHAAQSVAEEQHEEPVADFSQAAELSDEEKALVEQYKQMMEQLGLPPMETPKPSTPVQTAAPKTRQSLIIGGTQEELQALREEYSRSLQEMNDLMSQLIPDPGTSPQIQRNYYSARKLPVITTEVRRERVAWVCNLCGCHHNQPSVCAEPDLGGTWIYQDVVVTTKKYV